MCEEVSEIVTRLVAPDAHLVSPESKQLESGLASYRTYHELDWGNWRLVAGGRGLEGFLSTPIFSQPQESDPLTKTWIDISTALPVTGEWPAERNHPDCLELAPS